MCIKKYFQKCWANVFDRLRKIISENVEFLQKKSCFDRFRLDLIFYMEWTKFVSIEKQTTKLHYKSWYSTQ